MSRIRNRDNWKFIDYNSPDDEYNMTDLINYYIGYMSSKTLMMFEWTGLPDDINSFDIEKVLQFKGFALLVYDDSKSRWYVLDSSVYDNITWNYEPSKGIIANPALPELNGIKWVIGENCILIRNDWYRLGLFPIFEKNAMDLASTDISIRYASFNTRLKSIFASTDDNTTASLKTLLDDAWSGKRPTAIVDEEMYKNSIQSVQYNVSQSSDIVQLIELKQYQLANWWIELCVNANYNMKRESLNEKELNMNQDALLPMLDQMNKCRLMACEDAKKFGLNIGVKLSSSWNTIKEEAIQEEKLDEAEIKKAEAEAEAEADATLDNNQGGDNDEKNEN